MGESKRRQAKDPMWGKPWDIEYGALVGGDFVGMPMFASLMPFSATRGSDSINGWVHPTIRGEGNIYLQFIATDGTLPKDQIQKEINRNYKKWGKSAGLAAKAEMESSHVVIVVPGD